MITTPPLPDAYRTAVRRLVRLAAVLLFVGLCIGLYSTDVVRAFRYGKTARLVPVAERTGQVEVEVPPELLWEATMDLRLSHGHVILIGGILPLCIAAALVVTHLAGATAIGKGTLEAFFWMYAVGATLATGIILYKGIHYAEMVRAGTFDFGEIQRTLFGGSRAIKGAAYGLSHSVLAGSVGVIGVALWRSVGSIRSQATPPTG
jgi:hypothetical protein